MLNYYCANIDVFDKESFFADSLEKVDEKRREKVLRCKNEADQKRSLLAGLLLRYGLEAAGYSYDEVVIDVTSTGKPYIISDMPIHFSISHSGEYVGCVISDEPVGLDIEFSGKPIFSLEKRQTLEAMAKKCLSEAEKSIFDSSLEKEKLFLVYWTKKEAYSKFLGKGLGVDFSEIDTEDSKKNFWTSWTRDGYHVSIYRKSQSYEELTIEQVGFDKL